MALSLFKYFFLGLGVEVEWSQKFEGPLGSTGIDGDDDKVSNTINYLLESDPHAIFPGNAYLQR